MKVTYPTLSLDEFEPLEHWRRIKSRPKWYLRELQESIATRGFLPFFPLWVGECKGKYYLLNGFSRMHCLRQLGIDEVVCEVFHYDNPVEMWYNYACHCFMSSCPYNPSDPRNNE